MRGRGARWLRAAVLVGACGAGRPDPAAFAHIADRRVSEPSALLASPSRPGLYWTVNDSGGKPTLYGLDLSGRVVESVKVRGAENVDWEALAARDGHLLIGDLGDNDNMRRDLAIYVVPEPAPGAGEVTVTSSVPVRYRDRPPRGGDRWDAEALFVADGALFGLTKQRSDFRTRLFRVPEGGGEVEFLDEVEIGGRGHKYGGMVTDASLSVDGARLAVLTYHAVIVFERSPDQIDWLRNRVREVSLDPDALQQCESIAWDGPDLIIGNEQGDLFRLAPGDGPRFPAP